MPFSTTSYLPQTPGFSQAEFPSEVANPEHELLGADSSDELDLSDTGHSLKTAPIFTGDVFHATGAHIFPQRASYGRVLAQAADGFPNQTASPELYINTNAPFSALVCGVQVRGIHVSQFPGELNEFQGSGKSHSTAVLLESCLIQDRRIGTLPAPLSGIV